MKITTAETDHDRLRRGNLHVLQAALRRACRGVIPPPSHCSRDACCSRRRFFVPQALASFGMLLMDVLCNHQDLIECRIECISLFRLNVYEKNVGLSSRHCIKNMIYLYYSSGAFSFFQTICSSRRISHRPSRSRNASIRPPYPLPDPIVTSGKDDPSGIYTHHRRR